MTGAEQRDAVGAIIRDAAQAEIMPRFRNLADGEVAEKSNPRDLVTAADVGAEAFLSERLTALLPGSRTVGEEGAEEDPSILDALQGDAPVWVLDPVDGTRNYAHGETCFAVIVALVVGGETRAGWIYSPVDDVMVWSEQGAGVWSDAGGSWQAVSLTSAKGLENARGSLPRSLTNKLEDTTALGETTRYFCCGREYMDFFTGRLDYAVYGGLLKPWDHAAGTLMVREGGGVVRTLSGGSYSPIRIVKNERLILATDEKTWQSLAQFIQAESVAQFIQSEIGS